MGIHICTCVYIYIYIYIHTYIDIYTSGDVLSAEPGQHLCAGAVAGIPGHLT